MLAATRTIARYVLVVSQDINNVFYLFIILLYLCLLNEIKLATANDVCQQIVTHKSKTY